MTSTGTDVADVADAIALFTSTTATATSFNTIAKVNNSPDVEFTQSVEDAFGITATLASLSNSVHVYYSTDKELTADGDVVVIIKVVKGSASDTVDITSTISGITLASKINAIADTLTSYGTIIPANTVKADDVAIAAFKAELLSNLTGVLDTEIAITKNPVSGTLVATISNHTATDKTITLSGYELESSQLQKDALATVDTELANVTDASAFVTIDKTALPTNAAITLADANGVSFVISTPTPDTVNGTLTFTVTGTIADPDNGTGPVLTGANKQITISGFKTDADVALEVATVAVAAEKALVDGIALTLTSKEDPIRKSTAAFDFDISNVDSLTYTGTQFPTLGQTAGVHNTYKFTTDYATGIATVEVQFTDSTITDTASFTISNFKTIEDIANEAILADKALIVTFGNQKLTTSPDALADGPTTEATLDGLSSLFQLPGVTTGVTRTFEIADALTGTATVTVTHSATGTTTTDTSTYTISGFKSAADIATAATTADNKVFTAMGSATVTAGTIQTLSAGPISTNTDITGLAGLSPSIATAVGGTRAYEVTAIDAAAGTATISVVFTPTGSTATPAQTFTISGFKTSGDIANDAIAADKALFSNFPQTLTGKPTMVTAGPFDPTTLTTNGHHAMPADTPDVTRTITVAPLDVDAGTATVTIAFSATGTTSTDTTTYQIAGFQTTADLVDKRMGELQLAKAAVTDAAITAALPLGAAAFVASPPTELVIADEDTISFTLTSAVKANDDTTVVVTVEIDSTTPKTTGHLKYTFDITGFTSQSDIIKAEIAAAMPFVATNINAASAA